MQADKENIHKLLWNQYKSGVKATEAAHNINIGLAHKVVNNRMAQRWFKDFRQGRQSIEQKKGQGRPPTVNRRVLAQRLLNDPDSSPAEIAKGVCHVRTAQRWLKKTGRKPIKSKWVPHRKTC